MNFPALKVHVNFFPALKADVFSVLIACACGSERLGPADA